MCPWKAWLLAKPCYILLILIFLVQLTCSLPDQGSESRPDKCHTFPRWHPNDTDTFLRRHTEDSPSLKETENGWCRKRWDRDEWREMGKKKRISDLINIYHLLQAWAKYGPGARYGLLGFLTCPKDIIKSYYHKTAVILSHPWDVCVSPTDGALQGWNVLLLSSLLGFALCLNLHPFSKNDWVKEKNIGQWVQSV